MWAAGGGHLWFADAGEMLDRLGMAKATPGPVIMEVQFVGFLGAYLDPGSLPPLLARTLDGLLTTWATFVPCFLWIFFGALYVETLRSNKVLSAALAAINAALVGVILNLAIWFAMHVLFGEIDILNVLGLSPDVPVLVSIRPGSLILTLAAIVAVFRFHLGVCRRSPAAQC